MKNFLTFFFVLFFFLLIFSQKVEAVDFIDSSEIEYIVGEEGVMHIKEIRTIKNNSSKYYIPAHSQDNDSFEKYYIQAFRTRSDDQNTNLEKSLNAFSVKDKNGVELNYSYETFEKFIEISIPFHENVGLGDQTQFVFEYDDYELVEKNGKVYNIYIPSFNEEYNRVVSSGNGAVTQYELSVSLVISKDLGEISFMLPEPNEKIDNGDNFVYKFDLDDLKENYGWVQIGTEQIYRFELTQKVEIPEKSINNFITPYYDLVIPRDFDDQIIYFEEISPEPEYIRKDGEGNIIARFKIDSNDIGQIVVTGYGIVKKSDILFRSDENDISNINYDEFYAEVDGKEYYFKDIILPKIYWEVDSKEISDTAKLLLEEKTNVYDIILANYDFVIENVDYDDLKVEISNERQGALKTLQGGSSVCMEYSDLLITLLRAQKIPSRAVFGYGYDPRDENTADVGHQWVQAYLPDYGWVSIDPTWGDGSRRDYIGGDLDHFLWYVAGIDVDTPPQVVKQTTISDSITEGPVINVATVGEIDVSKHTTLEDLLKKYPYSNQKIVEERWNQLNSYGRGVVLFIISIVVLLMLFVVVKLFVKIFKKI